MQNAALDYHPTASKTHRLWCQSSVQLRTWLSRSVGFDVSRTTYVLKIRNLAEAEPASLLDSNFHYLLPSILELTINSLWHF